MLNYFLLMSLTLLSFNCLMAGEKDKVVSSINNKIYCKEKNCRKKFSTQAQLLIHLIRIHNYQSKLQEDQTNLQEAQSVDLKNPIDEAKKLISDLVDKCPKYINKGALTRYLFENFTNEIEQIQKIVSSINIEEHIDELIHTIGEKKHVCLICLSMFTQKQTSKRHIEQLHLNIKNYFCRFPDCPRNKKGFNQKSHLELHESTHNKKQNMINNLVDLNSVQFQEYDPEAIPPTPSQYLTVDEINSMFNTSE